MDAATARRIGRLDNPDVPLRLRLLKLLVVRVKVMEFIRQNVRVWDEIKLIAPKTFLHFDIVETEAIFACNFVWLWKMVDPLVLVQSFVQITFATWAGPEYVPLVRICKVKWICFEEWSDQLCVPLKQFVQHFWVVNVIAALWKHCGRRIVQQLGLVYGCNWNNLVESLCWRAVQILTHVVLSVFNVTIRLVKEILLSSWLSVVRGGNEEWKVIFDVS